MAKLAPDVFKNLVCNVTLMQSLCQPADSVKKSTGFANSVVAITVSRH